MSRSRPVRQGDRVVARPCLEAGHLSSRPYLAPYLVARARARTVGTARLVCERSSTSYVDWDDGTGEDWETVLLRPYEPPTGGAP